MKMEQYIVNDEYLGTKEKFDTYEEANDYCLEQDIIYYSKAMNYLMENDFSLRESIEMCVDMGYDLENINSELLASVHYQDALLQSIEEVEVEEVEEEVE